MEQIIQSFLDIDIYCCPANSRIFGHILISGTMSIFVELELVGTNLCYHEYGSKHQFRLKFVELS